MICYDMILYYMILYRIILYYIVLYDIIFSFKVYLTRMKKEVVLQVQDSPFIYFTFVHSFI